jgi:uncharacterized membrane protein YhaH (DUF805 family)
MQLIDFFFNLDGRISRKKFWIGILSVIAAEFVALAAVALVFDADWPLGLVALLFNYPHFVIWAKRGHDCDIPAWVIAPLFVCSAAFSVQSLFGWHAGVLFRDPLFFALYVLYSFAAAVLLLILGIASGTLGPNCYGADPLGPRALPAHA